MSPGATNVSTNRRKRKRVQESNRVPASPDLGISTNQIPVMVSDGDACLVAELRILVITPYYCDILTDGFTCDCCPVPVHTSTGRHITKCCEKPQKKSRRLPGACFLDQQGAAVAAVLSHFHIKIGTGQQTRRLLYPTGFSKTSAKHGGA